MNEQREESKYLYEIKSLKKDETDTSQVIQDIQNHIKDKDPFEYDRSILQKKNFIFTPNSIERIRKIAYYISRGVPVLLEGPTATSKSIYNRILLSCSQDKKTAYQSSDTVPSALLGKMVER